MFTRQKKLPSIEYVRNACPLSPKLQQLKLKFDEHLRENFAVRSKFTVVCGPCSADNYEAMREYLGKLSQAQSAYPHLLIAARVYTTKPHSNGQAYLGTCFHERANEEADLEEGILRARSIMVECIKLGLPVADELLYPELYPYFADLVSYWFVGARSSEDALHRGIASGLDLCCGVKNGTDGDVLKVVDSLYAVSNPCVFPLNGLQIATNGCKYAHIVLRGGKSGNEFSKNILPEHTRLAKERLREIGLNDFVMADLSHANSGKVAANQIKNARLVVKNSDINGVIIESYLYDGIAENSYGVSKTDDCLSFDDTLKLLDILQNGFTVRKRRYFCPRGKDGY